MIVVILARSADEAKTHAQVANLAERNVLIPGSATSVRGRILSDGDLVVELPGFVDRPGSEQIRAAVQQMVDIARRHGHDVLWHQVAKGSA